MKCPKCNYETVKYGPQKRQVNHCTSCGFICFDDGSEVINPVKDIDSVIKGVKMADDTIKEVFEGRQLNPAIRALLQARMMEFGLDMWFDGFKQGLILMAKNCDKKEGADNGEVWSQEGDLI